MVEMNLHVVKAQLSKVARMVKNGETIILCERNKPIAEIRPLPGANRLKKRELGQMKGACPVGLEFFESDAELADQFLQATTPEEPSAAEGSAMP